MVEAKKLATSLSNSETAQCKEASDDLLSMNLSPTIVKDIYASYVSSLEALGKLRKGFYCVLCDARTQEKPADFYSVTNLFYNDRIYFD